MLLARLLRPGLRLFVSLLGGLPLTYVYLGDRRGGSSRQRSLLSSLCQAVSDRSFISLEPSADASTLCAGLGGRMLIAAMIMKPIKTKHEKQVLLDRQSRIPWNTTAWDHRRRHQKPEV